MLLWVRGLEEGCRVNPVAGLHDAPDAVLHSLKFAAHAHLSQDQFEIAKLVALRVPTLEVSVSSLVQRWRVVDELRDFANAVEKTFLPRQQGETRLEAL